MNTILNIISKLRDIIARHSMLQAALLLRKDYNDPSMTEFTILDSAEFWDYT